MLVAVAVAVGACNSTTRRGLHVASQLNPDKGSAATQGSSTGATSGAASASADGTAAGTSSGGVTARAGSSGAGTATRATIPGGRTATAASTTGTVKIGVVLMNYGNVAQAVGAKAVSQVASKEMAQPVIDSVNAEGGLAGRKIVPVYLTNDITQGEYSTQAQTICTTLTEDNPVFAVVGSGVDPDPLAACLAKHKTPFIPSPWLAVSVGFMDEQQMGQYAPYIHWPNMLDPRQHTVAVDRWVANKFLTASNRIGLIRTDAPAFARVADGSLKPRLASHGLHLTDEVAIPLNNSVADVSGPASQEANTVLRFRSQNIDRVLFVAPTGGGAFFFMPAAENQGYRPKYGLTSFEQPYFLASNESASQLSGAQGIGWQPSVDTDPQHDPGPTPGRAACVSIMKKAGLPFGDRSGENAMYGFCESFFYLRAALAGTSTLSAASLQAGADRLGTSFPSVLTFGERFAPGRRAAVSAVRDLHYDDGCSCFVYSGPSIPVG